MLSRSSDRNNPAAPAGCSFKEQPSGFPSAQKKKDARFPPNRNKIRRQRLVQTSLFCFFSILFLIYCMSPRSLDLLSRRIAPRTATMIRRPAAISISGV